MTAALWRPQGYYLRAAAVLSRVRLLPQPCCKTSTSRYDMEDYSPGRFYAEASGIFGAVSTVQPAVSSVANPFDFSTIAATMVEKFVRR